MSFQIGDVIELKSGGPKMTVSAISESGVLECTWFNSENMIQTGHFNKALVQIYKKPRPRPLARGMRL